MRKPKITFGEMRDMGVRGLLVYCSDYHCSHWTAISGDQWPDDVGLSDIEQRFTCQACGPRVPTSGRTSNGKDAQSPPALSIGSCTGKSLPPIYVDRANGRDPLARCSVPGTWVHRRLSAGDRFIPWPV